MNLKPGDIIRIVVYGQWHRGHPVPDGGYDVKVFEVRRRWATVIFESGNFQFARDLRFFGLKPEKGMYYKVFYRNFKGVPWKRRDIVSLTRRIK